MNLANFIYKFNLVTTGTAQDIYERCQIVSEGCEREIDYKDSINLYDIVDIFNVAYLVYTLEKDEFKSILSQLGKEIIYRHHYISDNLVLLVLDVLDPKINVFDGRYAKVEFININVDEYLVNADDGKRVFYEEFESKGVDIERESIKKCLDLVRRHNLFLECFRKLKNNSMFSDGTTAVFSKIEGDIFNKLSTFTLSFGNSYMNSSDFIEVKFRLGKNLKVLYGRSKVAMDDEKIKDIEEKKRIIDELLRSIYVNSDKLCSLYKVKTNEKVLVKERI